MNQIASKKIFIPIVLSLGLLLPSLITSRNFTDPFLLPKYFYFYFFASVFLFVFCVWNLGRKYYTKITITWLDLAVLAYIFYQFIHALFTPHISLANDNLLVLLISGIFYFAIKPWLTYNEKNKSTINIFIIGIVLLCFAQVCYGALQYLEILPRLQEEFKIGGAYGNPGPYANILVPLIPFTLALIIYGKKKKALRYFCILTLIVTVIILPLTNARTAWIATLLAVLYVLYSQPIIKEFVHKWISKLWIKIVALALTGILLAGIAIFLFKFKEQSSSGRLFIWKVSLQMVADKPIFGFGFDKYAVAHNNYQAEYFADNPDAKEEGELADAVSYAFNEYIQIASETGLTGLILFLALAFFSFFKRKQEKYNTEPDNWLLIAARGSLLAILISAMFSYPLRSVPGYTFLLFVLSIISANDSSYIKEIKFKEQQRVLISIFGIVILMFFTINQVKKFKASQDWLEAFTLVRSREHPKAVSLYEELYPILKYNQFFLFNYGAELSVMGEYQKSIELLREAETRLNDADLYIYLGNSYVGISDLNKAIYCFKKASLIMPVKFYPKYRLVKIYLEMNERERAIDLAKEILSMQVKIPSDIISNIRNEMQELVLNSYSLNYK